MAHVGESISAILWPFQSYIIDINLTPNTKIHSEQELWSKINEFSMTYNHQNLKLKLYLNNIQKFCSYLTEDTFYSITNANRLMLLRNIIDVYFKNYMQDISTLWAKFRIIL